MQFPTQFAAGVVLGILVAISFTLRFRDTATQRDGGNVVSNTGKSFNDIIFHGVQRLSVSSPNVGINNSPKPKSVQLDAKTNSTTATDSNRNINHKAAELKPQFESSSSWVPGKEGMFISGSDKIEGASTVSNDLRHDSDANRRKRRKKDGFNRGDEGKFDTSDNNEKDSLGSQDGKRGRRKWPRQRLPPNSDGKYEYTAELSDSGTRINISSSASTILPPNIIVYDKDTGDIVTNNIEKKLAEKSILPYPPLQPYHSQSSRPPPPKPYIPTLESVKEIQKSNLFQYVPSIQKPLPNMTLQRAIFEKDNLKLHLCNAVFEAYSASYLTTREHILAVKSESFNLSWVNCEMASFVHMRETKNFLLNPYGHGMIIQSLDVLDFSAIHLSAFERSSKKYKHILWKSKEDRQTKWTEIDVIKETAKMLYNKINPKRTGKQLVWSKEAQRTVVIMPFLGGVMGAGHSELGNRFEYLKACFWSIYEFMPHIVAGVTRQVDVDWAMKESGLPFYDMLLIEGLPKSAGLPLATVRKTKERLQSGQWDFDYVFFTESDQIIISRILPSLYENLKQYPRRMILPHRLMPYSDRVMIEVHKRSIDREPNKWMEQSCCLPRQNCEERLTWRSVADPEVPIINYYGLYVPLGNINFLREEYRGCTIGPYIPDYCP